MPQRASPAAELAQWTAVDRYYEGLLGAPDPVLAEALRASAAAGLPDIQVSPLQGEFLRLLATAVRARRILEIGTLGGYSAICLARALGPVGRLLTLELEPKHAAVAEANLRRAGLSDRTEVRVGPAEASLRRLIEERTEPFDLVFIDADKTGYPAYFDGAVRLSRAGTVIVADNVVRRGDVVDAASADPSVLGVRRMHERIARAPGVRATVVQTVGAKGYDGFTLAVVGADRPTAGPRLAEDAPFSAEP